jgi:hypothetical protein
VAAEGGVDVLDGPMQTIVGPHLAGLLSCNAEVTIQPVGRVELDDDRL